MTIDECIHGRKVHPANDPHECVYCAITRLRAAGEMLAAVVQGAQEEFVRAPYGASHEGVAAINAWHRMAKKALEKWEGR